jgi:16S rRNA (uracil1498-N3)-methyltransferase
MELYFTEPENISSAQAEFDSFESRHIIKTMRKKEGEPLHFTDGRGNLYAGRIIATHPVLRVSCQAEKKGVWPSPVQSVLGVASIRPARMDILIEKATELGITRFVLFSSRFSNFQIKNSKRWEKITRQAIKQSNRFYLPEIQVVSGINDFFSAVADIQNKYCAQQDAARRFNELLTQETDKKTENIVILVGPEGGLDDIEINQALAQGFIPLNLGAFRLRTETAAISAASFINILRN